MLTRQEKRVEKLTGTFKKYIEIIKKNQSVLKNTVTKIKNKNNSRVAMQNV